MKISVSVKELYSLIDETEYLCTSLQRLTINETLTKEQMCQWVYQGLSDDLQWHTFVHPNHPVTNKKKIVKIPVRKDIENA